MRAECNNMTVIFHWPCYDFVVKFKFADSLMAARLNFQYVYIICPFLKFNAERDGTPG